MVAEIEPEALVPRRWTDHRPHVRQAGTTTEPGFGIAPGAEGKHLAPEWLDAVEMCR